MTVLEGQAPVPTGARRAFPLGSGSRVLDGLLGGVALLAVAVPAVVVATAAPVVVTDPKLRAATPQRVVPAVEVPEVEPIEFQDLAPADARAFNATVPFSTHPNPAARPFRFGGAAEDRLRAVDCLAAAVLYEAGDDPVGQRAVAQVVLNRVRHPAFPKTVCGVVFQGAERRTGCQFTFTCDGALARWYSEPFWTRARAVAEAALAGGVYKPVGHATHYHTDWVVPYWSSSLDKIVAVDTHLFFRWTGWWGTPPAFRFGATGSEPRIIQLAAHFPEHKLPEALAAEAEALATVSLTMLPAGAIRPSPDDPNAFFVTLPAKDVAGFQALAVQSCGDRSYCKFLGWTDPTKVPRSASSTLTPVQLTSMSFSYLRDRSRNFERALWNCTQFERPAGQCMRRDVAPAASPSPASTTAPTALALPVLEGVRRKAELKPSPTPAPSPRAEEQPR